jgi:hypothetical protein
MKTARLFPSFLVACVLTMLFLSAARGADDATTIKFSDPAKPGTLRVSLARGNLRVKGADVAEITVKSDAKPVTSKAVRKDGLRVLTAASSFSLTEKDNIVTLDAASDSHQGGGSDFTLTAPRNTTVIVSTAWGGDVHCSNLGGDIEVRSMNGSIRLDDVSGGVVVETMNGEINASIRELHDTKPLSFQSTNGEVVLRLPADAKANVRLRTQNGSVLTDFDDTVLVTKTETAPRTSTRRTSRTSKPAPAAPAAPSADTVAPEAPRAPKAPAAAPKPSKPGLDESDKEEIRVAVRESVRAGAEVAREAMVIAREAIHAAHEGMAEAGISIRMPNLSIPTITGGKLVTGTLNGGGPEITVATMNGDVTLRQLEKK